MADLNFPSMFDTRYAIDRQMELDAQNVGQAGGGSKRYGMYYNSALGGDLRNQGLMGLARLMGGSPDPRIAKQQALDEVMQRFPEPETPEDLMEIANALQASGLYNEAAQATKMATEMRASMPTPTKPGAVVEGYKLAVEQGYDKGFFQYQIDLKQAASEKNISIGNIPQGFEVITNSKGNIEMRVIPGGPADIEQTELTVKGQAEQMLKQNDAAIVLKNVSLVREAVLNPKQILGFTISPVGFGSWLSDVPSTQAMGVKNMIKTIKANIGFGKLQSMREVSPTGGALGQVSNIELELLTSVIGGLEQAQSKEDVLRVLDQIEQTYNMIVHGQTGLEIIYGNTDPAEVD